MQACDSICDEIVRVAQPLHQLVICAFFKCVRWEEKDRALGGVGLCDDGHGWLEVSREAARSVGAKALSLNLAYHVPVIFGDRVSQLVDALLEELPAHARFFANFDPPLHVPTLMREASAKTHDLIDTGLVVEANDELIAALWVADDD